jgi:hypothetical protein
LTCAIQPIIGVVDDFFGLRLDIARIECFIEGDLNGVFGDERRASALGLLLDSLVGIYECRKEPFLDVAIVEPRFNLLFIENGCFESLERDVAADGQRANKTH